MSQHSISEKDVVADEIDIAIHNEYDASTATAPRKGLLALKDYSGKKLFTYM